MRELQEIERWLQLNGLFINVTKTEAMLFGTSQRLSKVNHFKIDINGFEIKRVTKFKYLGVIFNEHHKLERTRKGHCFQGRNAGRSVGTCASFCWDVCVVISLLIV